ncbi:MAG TPA: PRC-barrel domain-containing protein [Lacunisphaera sp.]|nr:PRC-barrel domain-containing protein [Lacunisphaera sp.]
MFKTATELKRCTLRAWDGEIGKVTDLYFDNLHWALRYFVIDTGKWLKHRSVLISPESVLAPEWDNHVLPVELTREQIRNSPGLETDRPVSRQYEAAMRKHYGWPPYLGGFYGDVVGGVTVGTLPPPPSVAPIRDSDLVGDAHLFSVSAATGHHVHATDGEIGHVADFLIDDLRWTVRYLVVDPRNWLPGKKVLLSPWWSSDIDWPLRRITVDLTRDAIRNSPPYDPARNYTTTESVELHNYYGKPKYPGEDEAIGEAVIRSDNSNPP